ncbi:MAG: cysteine synthase family protein [Acholeplasmatales bacterium]|nr:cysteine synthase family protein [Acholeplasmatales bacterium]
MKKYYDGIDELIGNTPIVKLNKLKEYLGIKSNIFIKLESFNAGGSIKSRIAKRMVLELEKNNKINKNSIILEATSGNTGIGLALIGAYKGYNVEIVMPKDMSDERKKLLKSYGAKLYLTDGKDSIKESIRVLDELVNNNENYVLTDQFQTPINPLAHYETTGPEIYKTLGKKIDYFVSACGTGGTIRGCGKYLKEKIKNIKVVGVEPAGASLGLKHKIQGIGGNIKDKPIEDGIIDIIYDIEDEDAYKYARLLPKIEGISIGISSGAALASAVDIALKSKNPVNIVVISADSGDHYLSSDLYV